MTLTKEPEAISLARRGQRVGHLDNGASAFLVRPGDTEEVALAILDIWNSDYTLIGQEPVEWCPHTADYAYRHGCEEWCENPRPRMVWTARYREDAA